MSSVNISLKKEAYRFLQSLKTKDKSFSDVILEFRNKKGNKEVILELVREDRDLSKTDWNEKEKIMKEFRNSFDKRIEKTIKYMEKSRKNK